MIKGIRLLILLFVLCHIVSLNECLADAERVVSNESGQTADIDAFQETTHENQDNPELPLDIPEKVQADPTDQLSVPEKPRVAIIIDDMGNQHQIGEKLLELDLNLSFAFLPYASFTREQANTAWLKGRDILAHMPMEPKDSRWDPGPGALHVDDSMEQLVLSIEKNIALVPHAMGVNNHMGSLFTEDRQAMRYFLEVVRDKKLFFIDSVTSSASIAMQEAMNMGVKTAGRHVFLDNTHNTEDICRQLVALINVARKKGFAIGIGHPGEATLTALIRCRKTLLENVQLVGVNELVK